MASRFGATFSFPDPQQVGICCDEIEAKSTCVHSSLNAAWRSGLNLNDFVGNMVQTFWLSKLKAGSGAAHVSKCPRAAGNGSCSANG